MTPPYSKDTSSHCAGGGVSCRGRRQDQQKRMRKKGVIADEDSALLTTVLLQAARVGQRNQPWVQSNPSIPLLYPQLKEKECLSKISSDSVDSGNRDKKNLIQIDKKIKTN